MNKSKIVVVALFSLIIALFADCSKEPVQAPTSLKTTEDPIISEEPQKKAPIGPWGDWDKVVKEARKEDKVVLYSTLAPEPARAQAEGFHKAYGITVERISGNGQYLVQKVISEQRAGLYLTDVFDGGTDPWKQLADRGLVEPALLPEAMNLSIWKKDPYYLEPEKKRILVYGAKVSGEIHINANLVKPGELQSWQDLLYPKWKKKIIMHNPVIAGPGQGFFARSLVLGWVDEDYWKKMAEQEIFFTDNRRLVAEWLARDKAAIAIGGSETEFEPFRELGIPISSMWFKEGGYMGVKNITLIKSAPHPNAARLYINWLMSKEGQEIMSRTQFRVSQRKDVSEELVPERYRNPTGVKIHWLTLEQLTAGLTEDILSLARIVVGR